LKLKLALLLGFDTKVRSIPATTNKKGIKEVLERVLSGFNIMLSIHCQGLAFEGFGWNGISSLYDCWIQWNVGNSERQIPPLRTLGPREFLFIENMPKTDAEKRWQRGKHIDKRWPSQKIFLDMKFLCNYIESKPSEAGVDSSDMGLYNVWKMFEAAVKELIIPGKHNQRVDQLKWQMMVKRRVRKKITQGGGYRVIM
jgi:hypothetical protein